MKWQVRETIATKQPMRIQNEIVRVTKSENVTFVQIY